MPRRMRMLASFVTGRRTKLVVLASGSCSRSSVSPLGAKLGRRDPRRHRLVPARERRVDRGRRAARLAVRLAGDEPGPDRLPARRRADRGRQAKIAEDARRARGDCREDELPLDAAADGRRSARARRPSWSPQDGSLAYTVLIAADRLRAVGRLGQARPRDDRLGGRRDADPAHRRPRLQHRRHRGLQRHRHEAAVRDRAPRAGPARRDLPRGAGGADAADRRLLRLHDRQRASSTCWRRAARPSPRTRPRS